MKAKVPKSFLCLSFENASSDKGYFTYTNTDGWTESIEINYIDISDLNNLETVVDRTRYVNRFKVVRFKDGLYGYVRQSDKKVLPYRFYLASNFNEYGYAMVALKNGVTFIDTGFNVYTMNGWSGYHLRMLINGMDSLLPARIFQFSNGATPTAKIDGDLVSYCIGLNGYAIKDTIGDHATEVNEFGPEEYSITTEGIILADGSSYSWDELGHLAVERVPNFIDFLKKETSISKNFEMGKKE